MSVFPLEIWETIFSHLSVMGCFTDSDTKTWVRVGTSLKTIHAFDCVSKELYELSRPIATEFIAIRAVSQTYSLARALCECPRLAACARRHTERLDISLDVDSDHEESGDSMLIADRPQRIFTELKTILDACPNLIYLTFRSDKRITGSDSDIYSAFSGAFPALEVLRWNLVVTWVGRSGCFARSYSVLPVFRSLCVLDLSMQEKGIRDSMNEAMKELPLLHTLIGPFRTVCFFFFDVSLPSLRTFIRTRLSTADDISNAITFHENHGAKIATLDIVDAGSYPRNFCHYLQNVMELVLRSSAVEILKATYVGRNVKTLGIFEDNIDEQAPVLEDLASQTKDGMLPELQTIQFLQPEVVQRLRNSEDMRVCAGRLLNWSISVEDDDGNLIFSPS